MSKKINVIDTTLRDGSHAMSHSFTAEQVRRIVKGLDEAGVDLIEISHGDGLAGSSINYGFSSVREMDLIKEAAQVVRHAKLCALLIPGIGTIADLERACDNGIRAVRVATHVTEADVGIQHIKAAKAKDLFTVGFLMMVHMASPEKILEQARIFEACGADYINLADSAGHLLPEQVQERIALLKEHLSIPVGFHAHNNLGLAMANSVAAIRSGAEYIDGTLRGLGAGAGNCQLEVLAAVLERMEVPNGMKLRQILRTAETEIEPIMKRPQIIDSPAVMLGYAGVYSSFLLHAKRAADRFQLPVEDILLELGRRKMVGGQEDMILDVAYQMKKEA